MVVETAVSAHQVAETDSLYETRNLKKKSCHMCDPEYRQKRLFLAATKHALKVNFFWNLSVNKSFASIFISSFIIWGWVLKPPTDVEILGQENKKSNTMKMSLWPKLMKYHFIINPFMAKYLDFLKAPLKIDRTNKLIQKSFEI